MLPSPSEILSSSVLWLLLENRGVAWCALSPRGRKDGAKESVLATLATKAVRSKSVRVGIMFVVRGCKL